MDKSAPWTVLKGTLAISAISATATGVLGILKGQEHYGFLTGAAGLNSGITAAAFFSLREYIVSPILIHNLPTQQYEKRRRELGIDQPSPETASISTTSNSRFSSERSHKVLDSAVSGAATGGLLRGWKSGPKAALPGAVIVGAICTVLQLGYNEFGVQRLKYVSRQHAPEAGLHPDTIPQTGANVEALESASAEQPSSWKAKILSLMGVKRLSEEEYLERLKLQRDSHLMRIRKLERKLEEEKKAKENVQ